MTRDLDEERRDILARKSSAVPIAIMAAHLGRSFPAVITRPDRAKGGQKASLSPRAKKLEKRRAKARAARKARKAGRK